MLCTQEANNSLIYLALVPIKQQIFIEYLCIKLSVHREETPKSYLQAHILVELRQSCGLLNNNMRNYSFIVRVPEHILNEGARVSMIGLQKKEKITWG